MQAPWSWCTNATARAVPLEVRQECVKPATEVSAVAAFNVSRRRSIATRHVSKRCREHKGTSSPLRTLAAWQQKPIGASVIEGLWFPPNGERYSAATRCSCLSTLLSGNYFELEPKPVALSIEASAVDIYGRRVAPSIERVTTALLST
jgi:hypothetical protein